ncbi:hypothetical protein [uncultured Desulfobacter sp.]|uniref:hypothetical protein n=1 Tax=uncultured Desulfobacter sp. TaxID=240139 RepID=UPI002AABA55B|nr:hypothetical protein [uncultured Desulfobacter sp.]
MQTWYGPATFTEWLKRICSVLNLAILSISCIIIVSEFRFDWCERLVGNYLSSTNDTRPENGAIWEAGRHMVNAMQSLDQMAIERESTGRTVRTADSFTDLIDKLGPGEWGNLDKERFRQLYLSLPPYRRRNVVDPVRLVWLLNGSATDRIFCEGRMGGIKIFFIDSQNRVVQQVDLDAKALGSNGGQNGVAGTLEDLPEFSGKIYPSSLFFSAVSRLPEEMRSYLIPDTESLLSEQGSLDRVGVGNSARDGFIFLGFEFRHMGESRVVEVKAREWAVWQLTLVLRGEG